jgi:hypothetical protein
MREAVNDGRVRAFLAALGREADVEVRAYLTGGATAVMLGWRASTADVDLIFTPERDRLLRAIPRLKDELDINVELVSPAHFMPELPGWESRSLYATREGRLTVYHYDLYAQALAKIERWHPRDRIDVQALVDRGLVLPARARALYAEIEPLLYRFPAIEPAPLRERVDALFPPGAPPP